MNAVIAGQDSMCTKVPNQNSQYQKPKNLRVRSIELRTVAKLKNFRVVNVVASTRLNREIDIERMKEQFRNAEYNPEIWPGLVWRRTDPKSTIILFSSGVITSVGTKSEEEARVAIQKAVESIPGLENVQYEKPRIVNLVAMADFGEKIDFELLVFRLPSGEYRPEQFPGLIYKLDIGRFLIFSSGKICLIGAKSEKQAKASMEKMVTLIGKI
jgi:transcription initiation factor TFIID TATA-box-binding protein